jgi:hypothetical protein
MSDIDPGYTGGDLPDTGHDDASYGDLHAGHEDFNLDHGHDAFGQGSDHFQDLAAQGDTHASQLDEHFATGHHVESDDPNAHFEEDNFANGDLHAAQLDQNFDLHSAEGDHANSFGDIDQLRESFAGDTLSAHQLDDGGSGELSAVSN